MSDKTGIQWTDATWTCITGCTKVSAGCDHCYAETLALRLQKMGSPKYRNGFAVTLHENALTIPLKWREPRRVFVNSMSDLFHVDVPREFIDRILAVMALTPKHTYQVLTKRPQRAVNYLADPQAPARIFRALSNVLEGVNVHNRAFDERGWIRMAGEIAWPLSNLWLGTSVENQREMHRARTLLRAPAAVRFLSCEPLLGPLDLTDVLYPTFAADDPRFYQPGGRGVDWVIVGGESGPNYRALDPQWARAIRDQCQQWGVAFFFKQHGGFTPKAGGRLLDGQTWDQFPQVPAAVPV